MTRSPGWFSLPSWHHHPLNCPAAGRLFGSSAAARVSVPRLITYDDLHGLRCHMALSQKFRTCAPLGVIWFGISLKIWRYPKNLARFGHQWFLGTQAFCFPRGQVSSQVRGGLGREKSHGKVGGRCGDLQMHVRVYLCIVHLCVHLYINVNINAYYILCVCARVRTYI